MPRQEPPTSGGWRSRAPPPAPPKASSHGQRVGGGGSSTRTVARVPDTALTIRFFCFAHGFALCDTFLFSDAQAVSLAGLRPPPRFRWPARPPLVILTSLFPRGLDRHYMYPSTFAVAASLCVYLRCVGSGVQRARGAVTCSANIDNPNPPLSYTGSSQERPTRASGLACRDEKYLYLDLYGLYCSSTAGSRRYTEQRAPHRSRIRHSPSHPHTEQ